MPVLPWQKATAGVFVIGLVVAGLITSLALSGKNVVAKDSRSRVEGTFESPGPFRPPKSIPADCPNLDSLLYQLTLAPDPGAFAAQAGLAFQDGNVLVIVALQSAGAPPDPTTYGLGLEAEYADLVQAWVPVEQLCPLAADSTVVAVRPPARPVPDRPTPVDAELGNPGQ